MWIMTFHIVGRIIPTDELIFFRGVGYTTNQYGILSMFIYIYVFNGLLP